MIARPRLVVLGAALTIVLVIALVVVLVRAGRTASPVLLDESDFAGVQEVDQDTNMAASWTYWCIELNGVKGRRVATTWMSFGGYNQAGAALIDGSAIDVSADENLDLIEDLAQSCAESMEESEISTLSMEPLTGLDADATGWRAESPDGTQGEYIVIKVDDWRVLAVSYQAYEFRDLVDMDELVRLAREGAAQFEPDRG